MEQKQKIELIKTMMKELGLSQADVFSDTQADELRMPKIGDKIVFFNSGLTYPTHDKLDYSKGKYGEGVPEKAIVTILQKMDVKAWDGTDIWQIDCNGVIYYVSLEKRNYWRFATQEEIAATESKPFDLLTDDWCVAAPCIEVLMWLNKNLKSPYDGIHEKGDYYGVLNRYSEAKGTPFGRVLTEPEFMALAYPEQAQNNQFSENKNDFQILELRSRFNSLKDLVIKYDDSDKQYKWDHHGIIYCMPEHSLIPNLIGMQGLERSLGLNIYKVRRESDGLIITIGDLYENKIVTSFAINPLNNNLSVCLHTGTSTIIFDISLLKNDKSLFISRENLDKLFKKIFYFVR